MATLITGQSQLLTLQPSDKYTVTVGANTEAYIDLGAGTDGSGYDSVRLTSEGTNKYTIGEYGRVAKVTIRCVVGSVDYSFGDSSKLDIKPADLTSSAIADAIKKAVDIGGFVALEAKDYVIDSEIPLIPNARIIGVPPVLQFNGDIPDAEFSCVGGTRLIISSGVTAFTWNNVDKGAEEQNIAENACSGVKLYGFTGIGGKRVVDTGALNAMGMVYSEFDQLYGFDQTDDYSFQFTNFQHCKFGRIYTSSQLTVGGGVYFGSKLSPTLLPGNSQFTDEIYTYSKNALNKSIVFEATHPSNATLNQIKVSGRLQGNRYGAATPTNITLGFVSGDPWINVSDNAQFNLCRVGMPLVLSGAIPAGFQENTAYFVIERGANKIKLAEAHYQTTPITPSATATYTVKCSGWPSLEVKASAGSAVKNSDFGQIDAEAFGNVCAVYVAKTRNCKIYMSEIMTSNTETALVTRDAEIGIDYAGLAAFTQDISASYGWSNCFNLSGGPYVHSSGNITLDAGWNGRNVRYTGTTDITVIIPKSLPRGFEVSFTTTGATGVVSFSPPSGFSVVGKNGTRSNGQNATITLTNLANKLYRVTGDTQI